MDYRPQFDSLRGLAVACVLFSHFWFPISCLGTLGVLVFFVLSGFLITSILLEHPGLGAFYKRRALRLLPAFYIAVLSAIALNLPGMRDTWPWHVFQATNIYFAVQGNWSGPWMTAHLWSLNVEEQFYAIWPLILKLPRRWLPWAFAGVALLAPIYRNVAPGFWSDITPMASFDALGAGALLVLFPRRVVYLGFAAGPLVLSGLLWPADWNGFTTLGSVALAAALVLAARNGKLTWIERPLLIWLGKISYGVYLYHLFVWAIVQHFTGRFDAAGWQAMLVCSVLTIAVATLSYRFIERPLRRQGSPTFVVAARLLGNARK